MTAKPASSSTPIRTARTRSSRRTWVSSPKRASRLNRSSAMPRSRPILRSRSSRPTTAPATFTRRSTSICSTARAPSGLSTRRRGRSSSIRRRARRRSARTTLLDGGDILPGFSAARRRYFHFFIPIRISLRPAAGRRWSLRQSARTGAIFRASRLRRLGETGDRCVAVLRDHLVRPVQAGFRAVAVLGVQYWIKLRLNLIVRAERGAGQRGLALDFGCC